MKQLPPNTHLEGQVNVWYDVDASLRTLGLLPSQLMPCLVCIEKETPKFQDPPKQEEPWMGQCCFCPEGHMPE